MAPPARFHPGEPPVTRERAGVTHGRVTRRVIAGHPKGVMLPKPAALILAGLESAAVRLRSMSWGSYVRGDNGSRKSYPGATLGFPRPGPRRSATCERALG